MMVRFSFIVLATLLLAATGCQKRPGFVTPIPGAALPLGDGTNDEGIIIDSTPQEYSTTYVPSGNSYNDSTYNSGGTYDPNSTTSTTWPVNDGFSANSFDTSNTGAGGGTPESTSIIGARDESALSANTVYFGFDSSAIRSTEMLKLSNILSYLNSNPSVRLRVEGHCDERGTTAYNLALGQRRASAAREYLIKAGVDASRLSSSSWGEDKPESFGKTEDDYAKNRRAEFVVVR